MLNVRTKGFTVVEILTVVIVIGILATLGTVGWQNQQKRARDTIRRSDVARIAEAFEVYAADRKNMMGNGSGCGWQDGGTGYISYTDAAAQYNKSIAQCLIDSGHMKKVPTDPLGPNHSSTPTNNNYTYMKYSCFDSGYERAFIFAKLETLPTGNVITDPNVCSHTMVDTSWGMNYYVEVK